TGNNTFSSATTINQGTLNAAAAGALGATSSINVNNAGTLLLSGNGNINRVSNSAGINLNGGTLAVESGGSGANALLEGTGSSIGLGALTLSANSTLDFGTTGVGTLTFASFDPTNGSTGSFTLN